MTAITTVGKTILAAFVSGAILCGCAAGADSGLPVAAAATAHADLRLPVEAADSHCKAFVPDFDQYAACERADGTLRSFGEAQIAWRVRYFVRFATMPCNEAPTVEEAYVFHMVVNDLTADTDLNAVQRSTIRAAMFEGAVHCQ